MAATVDDRQHVGEEIMMKPYYWTCGHDSASLVEAESAADSSLVFRGQTLLWHCSVRQRCTSRR
eukprot:3833529-Pyramimonas_sp.AAC.1